MIEEDAAFEWIRTQVLAATSATASGVPSLDPFKHQRDPDSELPQVVIAPHPARTRRGNGASKLYVLQDFDVVAIDGGNDGEEVSRVANLLEQTLSLRRNEPASQSCTVIHCIGEDSLDFMSNDGEGKNYLHRGLTVSLMTVRL